jgi:L-glutamine-phosphate cytidylyltransferase
MQAIILAAGEGSRLRPYTNDRPKCLVEVDGTSLLDRQLAVLHRCGISDLTLIKGYLADSFDRVDVRTFLNPRFAETNMVWTLFCARKILRGELIIAYGDIVYSRHVLETLLKAKNDFSIVIDRKWEAYWWERNEDPLTDAETLRLSDDGLITEIGKKPDTLAAIQGQYIGLMKFSAAGVARIRETFDRACERGDLGGKPPENAYMTDLLQTLIDEGESLHPVFIDGEWVEVDTASDLELPVTHRRLEQIEMTLD